HARWTERLAEIEREDARWRVEIEEGNVPAGSASARRIAPERQAEPDIPLRVSQITRAVRPNTLAWGDKLAIYLDRWRVFLTTDPLNNGMEGGVWPAIFGTMVLTVLLSIVVVPLGVMAALYLREYARQGWVTSVLRIAVNNLAGVPSIVYGVFGWGFFCYTIGRYIDRGPSAASVLPRFEWWFIFAGLAVISASAVALAEWLRRAGDSSRLRAGEGEASGGGRRFAGWTLGLLWAGAAGLVVTLLATTPYFWGFFAERAPNQVYAGRAVIWGALTLALLTLPVVIVATEEAIAAVPGSMREGSYGCGASKWQTIRRVVLPLAMPGLMTGAILAMARGAGEVAPLMLVGVAPTATELPVSGEFPYLHPERSIMHLAYHVFNVGLHSDDSEAAKPLVWTATLVLVLLVLVLNLVAIWLRARVRARAHSIF
ncbi:MAG: ABC transporter permease subunit, partial [Planctomycetota bacterium]|nr:ABC transporter permease subunit [Planctomycetota bacterium]